MILEWQRHLGAFSRHSMAWYWVGQPLLTKQRIAETTVGVLIDGSATISLANEDDAIVLVSDGSNWFRVADFP